MCLVGWLVGDEATLHDARMVGPEVVDGVIRERKQSVVLCGWLNKMLR